MMLTMLYEGKAKKVFATNNPKKSLYILKMMQLRLTVRKKMYFQIKVV